MTTSFNACRMTATVAASNFCFRTVTIAASIVECVLEFFCKGMMNRRTQIRHERFCYTRKMAKQGRRTETVPALAAIALVAIQGTGQGGL